MFKCSIAGGRHLRSGNHLSKIGILKRLSCVFLDKRSVKSNNVSLETIERTCQRIQNYMQQTISVEYVLERSKNPVLTCHIKQKG